VLRTRLWTAAVALPAVLAAILYTSDWTFTLIVGAFGAWGLYEIVTMTDARHSALRLVLVMLAGGVPLAIGLMSGGMVPWVVPAGAIVAMATLVGLVAINGPDAGVGLNALAFLGAATVGMLFPYLALMRNLYDGAALFILTLLVVVASDTGAYFTGVFLGRHKLAPRVSPNKTVEGAMGGLLASIAIALLLGRFILWEWDAGAMIGFGAVIALLAQLGDLANSAFKRCAHVKDSGWLFPGHGGLLDRASSLVFAAVFAYYWAS
jgi:phosphatidate cytidylyltransferase